VGGRGIVVIWTPSKCCRSGVEGRRREVPVLGSELLDPVSRWILSLILSILRILLLLDALETEMGSLN
jgi:hypothetical protein